MYCCVHISSFKFKHNFFALPFIGDKKRLLVCTYTSGEKAIARTRQGIGIPLLNYAEVMGKIHYCTSGLNVLDGGCTDKLKFPSSVQALSLHNILPPSLIIVLLKISLFI
jgi:hypothetical protein